MKVLIATPVHKAKDYSMERWLRNVKELRKQTPADFLMVDNTQGLDYAKKIQKHCTDLEIKDYELEHLDLPKSVEKHERITKSWEAIRKYVLNNGYDVWFTWECDQIIPKNALDVLAKHMQRGGYQLVHANTWAREIPGELNPNFGCALIARESLEKYSFLDAENMNIRNPGNPWDSAEVFFKRRVLRGGGKYAELYGLISPIQHLDNS